MILRRWDGVLGNDVDPQRPSVLSRRHFFFKRSAESYTKRVERLSYAMSPFVAQSMFWLVVPRDAPVPPKGERIAKSIIESF